MEEEHNFLEMIRALYEKEEVSLQGNFLQLSEEDEKFTGLFLEQCYQRESHQYYHPIPPFDETAALWSAKMVYHMAHLILYRETRPEELDEFIYPYTGEITPSSILSVDLCFRFMPLLVEEIKTIDPEDSLIQYSELLLQTWHYSAIGYKIPTETLDMEVYLDHKGLRQMYMNRIIKKKNQNLAQHDAWYKHILAVLGMYKKEFWNELELKKEYEQ